MKGKILFLDDSHEVLQGLQRMLHNQTEIWDMDFTSSSVEAMDMLTNNYYDVALLDIQMPGKNGLDILAEVKENPKTRDIEVVMLTGMRDLGLKRKALELGAADLLNKPIVKEDLIARLSNALRIKFYHDELHAQYALLEQELLQSQKMEIIGVLATGITHDFNNILTSTMLYSELVALYLPDDSPSQENLDKIQKLCEKAKKMIYQIRKFTQKQNEVCLEPHSLHLVIEESLELLSNYFPEGIKVEYTHSALNDMALVDSNQIYQLLMNLCINAVHAMKDEGVLTISLKETRLDDDFIGTRHETRPGLYLVIEVSDTGSGIDQGTLSQIFEPLFTTKGTQGTGIGLSVVKRIVKNHSGLINVKSIPGKGTTFFIYLPHIPQEVGASI